MLGMEHFDGITLLVLVAAIFLVVFLPWSLQKDMDEYHLQHTADSDCPECKDKP